MDFYVLAFNDDDSEHECDGIIMDDDFDDDYDDGDDEDDDGDGEDADEMIQLLSQRRVASPPLLTLH